MEDNKYWQPQKFLKPSQPKQSGNSCNHEPSIQHAAISNQKVEQLPIKSQRGWYKQIINKLNQTMIKQSPRPFFSALSLFQNCLSQYRTDKFENVPIIEIQVFKSAGQIKLHTHPYAPNNCLLSYQYAKNMKSTDDQEINKDKTTLFVDKLKSLELCQAGMRYLDAQNCILSQRCLELSIQTLPNYRSYNILGQMHYKEQNYNISRKYLEKAIFLDNRNPYLLNNLALTYLQQDERQIQKILLLSVSIKLTVPALNNLATLHFYRGNHKQALTTFKESLKIYESVNALNGISCAYTLLGEYSLQEQYSAKVRNYEQYTKIFLNNLANKYLLKGDAKKAENRINDGIKTDPSFAYFYNVLGLMNCMLQKYELSLKQYEKAIELQNLATFHSNYAICLIKAGKISQALQYLAQIIFKNQYRGEINLMQILYLLFNKCKYQELIDIVDRFIHSQTRSLYKILNYKAHILACMNQNQKSLDCLLQALRERQDQIILLNVACMKFHFQQYDQATKYVQRAIQMDPKQPKNHYYKGYFLLKTQKYQQSIQSFNIYLKLKPRSYRAINALGVCAFLMKKYDQAKSYFERSVSMYNNYYPAINNQGLLELQKQHNHKKFKIDKYFPNVMKNMVAQVYFNRANWLYRDRKYKLAISFYQKTLQLSYMYKQAYINLSDAEFKVGDNEQGVKTLRRAYTFYPECFKVSLQFSRYADIYISREYCQKYMNKHSKTQNLKLILNLAIMHKIIDNQDKYLRLLQTYMKHLYRKINENCLDMVREFLKRTKQIYCYLGQLYEECDAKDLLLLIGLFETELNSLEEAEKYVLAYIAYFKLKKQAVSATFIRIYQRRLVKYSQITRFKFYNCILWHLMRKYPQEGLQCCIKLRQTNKSIVFQSIVLDLIEQSKLTQQLYIKEFISYYLNSINNDEQTKKTLRQTAGVTSINRKVIIARYLLDMKHHILQMMQLVQNKQTKDVIKIIAELRNIFRLQYLRSLVTQHLTTKHLKQAHQFLRMVLQPITKMLKKRFNSVTRCQIDKISKQCSNNRLQIFLVMSYILLSINKYHSLQNRNIITQFKFIQLNKMNKQAIIQDAFTQLLKLLQPKQISEMSQLEGNFNYYHRLIENQQDSVQKDVSSEVQRQHIRVDLQQSFKNRKATLQTNYEANPHRQTIKPSNKTMFNRNRRRYQCKSAIVKKTEIKQPMVQQSPKKKRNKMFSLHLDDNESDHRRVGLTAVLSKQKKLIMSSNIEIKVKHSRDSLSIVEIEQSIHSESGNEQQMELDQNFQRMTISLSYVNSDQNTLFFHKLIYFSQIALIEQLHRQKSAYFEQIKIHSQTNKPKYKKINIAHLENNYYDYFYYTVKTTDAREVKKFQLSQDQIFSYLIEVGHILMELQRYGIHATNFELKDVGRYKDMLIYNNFSSAFRVTQGNQQKYSSFSMVKLLITFWWCYPQNGNANKFIGETILKGVQFQKIKEIWQYRKRYTTKQNRKQFDTHLQELVQVMRTAMKLSYSRFYTDAINQFRIRYNSPKGRQTISKHNSELLSQILSLSNNIQEPIPFLISSLTLIRTGEYQSQKQINYQLNLQSVQLSHNREELLL